MSEAKVRVNKDRTVYTFRFGDKRCPCCHQLITRRSIRVTYKKPLKPMTIFEGDLIEYIVYGLASSDLSYPPQYPRCPLMAYTNCQAGREWLANIEKVEIL